MQRYRKSPQMRLMAVLNALAETRPRTLDQGIVNLEQLLVAEVSLIAPASTATNQSEAQHSPLEIPEDLTIPRIANPIMHLTRFI